MGKQVENIGTILRTLREKHKLLLREVGAMISIDPTSLSKMERGERMPTREQIKLFGSLYPKEKAKLYVSWKSEIIYRELKGESYALQVLKIVHDRLNENSN